MKHDSHRGRHLLEWVIGIALGLLLLTVGTVLDAGGNRATAVLVFLLASVALVTPVFMTWKRRRRSK
jgi:hypothetical protein